MLIENEPVFINLFSLHLKHYLTKEKHDPNAFRDIILQGLNEIIAPQTGTHPKDSQTEAGVVKVNSIESIDSKQTATEEDLQDPEKASSCEQVNVDNGNAADVDSSKEEIEEETTNGQQLTDDSQSTTESNGETKEGNEQIELALTIKEITIEQAHFEALSKFLDVSGSKLNYRRYGEVLLDILIAGGVLGKRIGIRKF